MTKNILHNVVILACFALFASACATQRHTDTGPKSPAVPQPPAGVTYRKSGGLAGMNEWVTISSAGHLQVSGRLSGEGDADLTPDQRRDLAQAFAGWDALKDEYLPDRPAPDGLTLYVRYGTKGVTVVEPADVPPQFRAAVTAIESAARTVPRTR
jgi:hypothetical protein